jgi:hypothetical protein
MVTRAHDRCCWSPSPSPPTTSRRSTRLVRPLLLPTPRPHTRARNKHRRTHMQTPTHPLQTQHALGMEYAEEAEEHGIEHFGFTQGLNGSDTFVKVRAAWASSARCAIAPSYCCARAGKGTREHRARAPRRRRELLAAGAPPRIHSILASRTIMLGVSISENDDATEPDRGRAVQAPLPGLREAQLPRHRPPPRPCHPTTRTRIHSPGPL